jgi:hypothetical protein
MHHHSWFRAPILILFYPPLIISVGSRHIIPIDVKIQERHATRFVFKSEFCSQHQGAIFATKRRECSS